MRKLKDLNAKEKAEYIAVIALLPLFLLFRRLGKRVKLLSTRGRQLTASALCAALVLGMLPITAFASGSNPSKITEFIVNNNRLNVESFADDYWVYGTNSAVTKSNVESLPQSGWNWAIQVNYTTGEYAIKLNQYNGSYIMASKIILGSKCKLTLDVTGNNTITSSNYGMRLSEFKVTLQGNGNLNIKTDEATCGLQAGSLTVNLASNKKLTVDAVSEDDRKFKTEDCGISVSEFVLNSGSVSLKATNSTSENYAAGLRASKVTVNGGSLSAAANNTVDGGESYGICGQEKYNNETRTWEYPSEVYFNTGTGIEIKGGTMAVNSLNPPKVADGLKLWAGKTADHSDRALYDSTKFESYTYYSSAHIHCRCGAITSHEENNKCSYYEEQTYKPWSDPTRLPNGYTGYYLTTDVVLDKPWDMNCEMNLCLNGHSIIANGDFDTIRLGRTLWLSDCSELDKQGKITHADGTTGHGIVTKSYNGDIGELRMYGGNITGNTAESGAGIYCGTKGRMVIRGGSITNNTATENGGGLYNEGDVDIYACNITGNKAKYGGGIYVTKGSDQYSQYDSLILYGGTITGNTATEKGGGIYAKHYVALAGDETRYSGRAGTNYATVLNNTSGPEGSKKVDNASFASGQFLNMYFNVTGGKVSLNFEGVGTIVAITFRNLTSDFYLNEIALGNLRCDNPKFVPTLDYSNNRIVLKKALKELTANDFNFTAPSNLTYDGKAKEATITAKSGINCGKVTVKYYNEECQEVKPIAAGTYTVKLDVDESEIYSDETGLTDYNWKFTIAPKQVPTSLILVSGISESYIYNGSAQKPVPHVTVDGTVLTQGKDFTVSYGENTAVGKGSVTVNLTGNYKGSRTVELRITYGHASTMMYNMPAANKNGWYHGNVTVTAVNGYTIGETPNSFSDTLTFTGETAKGGKQVYLRAEDGKVYCVVLQYKIDSTAPENVTVQYNKNGFKEFLNKLTFGLFFNDTVNVEAKATDKLSGVDEILYYAADSKVEDTDSITEWQNSLSITPNSKKLIYVKVTDKAGNSVVLLDQGVVAYSDSTVSPASAGFDLKAGNRADIDFTVNLNGNTLREIKNGTSTLANGTDYTVSDNTVTVSKEYLSKFKAGTVQNLTFVLNPLGEQGQNVCNAVTTVTITDSTHYHHPINHPAKAPTCTADGNKEYYSCDGCDKLFWDSACTQEATHNDTVLKALNHTGAVQTPAKNEDCTNSGNSAYWYCSNCKHYFADKNGALDPEKEYTTSQPFEKKALGHDWTAWNITTPATFTKEGEQSRSCNRCKEKEITAIAKLVPAVTKGQNASFKLKEGSSLDFECNMTMDDNTVIMVDGKAIKQSMYRLGNGNAVTLTADYLNTLAVGNHTLAIQTADGTAQTTFTVTSAAAKPGNNASSGASSGAEAGKPSTGKNAASVSSPQTGDNANLNQLIAILLSSGAVISVIAVYRKKRRG